MWIGGREFLLAGRYDAREQAENAAQGLVSEWELVKVRSTPKARMGRFSVWVHGRK